MEISEILHDPSIPQKILCAVIDVLTFKTTYLPFNDIYATIREDMVEITATTGNVIICSEDKIFLTKNGWKNVKELDELSKNVDITDRPQLCVKIKNGVYYPRIKRIKKIGYGKAINFKINSNKPLLVEGFILK